MLENKELIDRYQNWPRSHPWAVGAVGAVAGNSTEDPVTARW